MYMKTKFSLSILLLLVLFTTNLSCRLSNKLVKTTTSYSEISECLDIVPLDLFHHLLVAAETRVAEILITSPSIQWTGLETSLNPLYLATPPPSLS